MNTYIAHRCENIYTYNWCVCVMSNFVYTCTYYPDFWSDDNAWCASTFA